MKKLTPSQIVIPAVVAALLVLAGMGIGVAVSDGDQDFSRQAAGAEGRLPAGDRLERHLGPRGLDRGARLHPGVRAVLIDIRRAVARRAPEIARPIIDKAVRERSISREQADRIRQRLGRLQQRAGRTR